jgi:hypothetical protein
MEGATEASHAAAEASDAKQRTSTRSRAVVASLLAHGFCDIADDERLVNGVHVPIKTWLRLCLLTNTPTQLLDDAGELHEANIERVANAIERVQRQLAHVPLVDVRSMTKAMVAKCYEANRVVTQSPVTLAALECVWLAAMQRAIDQCRCKSIKMCHDQKMTVVALENANNLCMSLETLGQMTRAHPARSESSGGTNGCDAWVCKPLVCAAIGSGLFRTFELMHTKTQQLGAAIATHGAVHVLSCPKLVDDVVDVTLGYEASFALGAGQQSRCKEICVLLRHIVRIRREWSSLAYGGLVAVMYRAVRASCSRMVSSLETGFFETLTAMCDGSTLPDAAALAAAVARASAVSASAPSLPRY